jgi:hypothetical protein
VACPTPWKVAFTTRAFAIADGRRARAGRQKAKSGQLRPYRCPGCGQWHLTTIDAKTFKQKKRQKRRAA